MAMAWTSPIPLKRASVSPFSIVTPSLPIILHSHGSSSLSLLQFTDVQRVVSLLTAYLDGSKEDAYTCLGYLVPRRFFVYSRGLPATRPCAPRAPTIHCVSPPPPPAPPQTHTIAGPLISRLSRKMGATLHEKNKNLLLVHHRGRRGCTERSV